VRRTIVPRWVFVRSERFSVAMSSPFSSVYREYY
jgi:hypothetical protein